MPKLRPSIYERYDMKKHRTYSTEERAEAEAYLLQGRSIAEIAATTGIPKGTIYQWTKTLDAKSTKRKATSIPDDNHHLPTAAPKIEQSLYDTIATIKEEMLTIAATLDAHLSSLLSWSIIDSALRDAGNLQIRLDTAMREKAELQAKLTDRAMAVHSRD
jgi:transposase-like protein